MLPDSFTPIPDLVRAHAQNRAGHPAIIFNDRVISWFDFDRMVDRSSAAFARDGLGKGDVIAIAAAMSPEYLILWIGALRVGLAVAPMASGMLPSALAAMIVDSGAAKIFDDAAISAVGDWWAADGAPYPAITIEPSDPFNLIYSSGTTGTPKGIVQPHSMRWAHVQRGLAQGYGPQSVTLVSTPLYSNTTLVSVFPTLGLGGTLVLLPKFDALSFLELSERHRATHAMLVPLQYARLMALDSFDQFDLSSYQGKFCTSAPFSAALKADVLARWPGGLTEYCGMTEGGGTCILRAHEHPEKLATVGQPAAGSDIRLIDDNGIELLPGETGEVVGRSPAMMIAYHNRAEATAAAEWHDPTGLRFIRTGDIGRFDSEGFLTLVDRKKDMIISGGFNIYPSDLEAVLATHPDVIEAAVVGVDSAWGESPVAFVVAQPGAHRDLMKDWLNERVGSLQRIADLVVVDAIPRSEIGKILKRELKDSYNVSCSAALP